MTRGYGLRYMFGCIAFVSVRAHACTCAPHTKHTKRYMSHNTRNAYTAHVYRHSSQLDAQGEFGTPKLPRLTPTIEHLILGFRTQKKRKQRSRQGRRPNKKQTPSLADGRRGKARGKDRGGIGEG